MSIKAINWALSLENLPTGPKCVLFVLANFANDIGECWPSFDEICKKSSGSRTTVSRYLTYMESNKIIKKEKRRSKTGYQSSNYYVLNLSLLPNCEIAHYDQKSIKVNDPRVHGVDSGQSPRCRLWKHKFQSSIQSIPEYTPWTLDSIYINHQYKPSIKNIKDFEPKFDAEIAPDSLPVDALDRPKKMVGRFSSDVGFDEFWKLYPRKVNKQKSLKIWKSKNLSKYLPEILIDLPQRTGWSARDPYTPHPTTYLNGMKWQDEEKVPPTPKRPETLEERNKRASEEGIAMYLKNKELYGDNEE